MANWLQNPMLHMGLGILGAQQTTPYPQSALGTVGRGALAGLSSYQDMMASQTLNQIYQQQLAMQQAEQDRRDRQREAAFRASGMLMPSLTPEQVAKLGTEGAEAYNRRREVMRGILGEYPQQTAAHVMGMLTPPTPGKPTSLMQNIEYMQSLPEGDPRREIIQQHLVTPPVLISQAPALPPNYKWADPANPAAGVVPIEGGPADPEVIQRRKETEVRTATMAKQKARMPAVESALDRYEDVFKKYGAELLPGAGSMELGAAYNDLMLELKELYNLGVLQGPDLAIMKQVIRPPVGFGAKMMEIVGGDEAFKTQIQLQRRKVKDKYREWQRAGRPAQSGPAFEQAWGGPEDWIDVGEGVSFRFKQP